MNHALTPNGAQPVFSEASECPECTECPDTFLSALLDKPLASRPDQNSGLRLLTLGTLDHVDAQGQLWVRLDSPYPSRPLRALSLCAVQPQHFGARCAVQFLEGDEQRPLVMGVIQEHAPSGMHQQAPAHNALPHTLEMRAREELVLSCGEASLRLSADGLVEIRGLHIDSQAEVTHRLRGGSVQVN